MAPATAKAGTAELMACLTLVAPSGMSAEDRQAWVAVAKATLTGIPADLLSRGCTKARETCRFASEIVPTILEEVRWAWDSRRRNLARFQPAVPELPPPPADPDYVDPKEVRKLIASLGSVREA